MARRKASLQNAEGAVMKGMMKRIIAVCMTFVILSVTPLNEAAPGIVSQTDTSMAAESKDGGKYISEIRIGMGSTPDQAKNELEEGGYTILKDDTGNYADLNVDAGSKSLLKEGPTDKIVYLGYKTTSDPEQAITDLAAINMGVDDSSRPYSVDDYNVLMEKAMESQIKPFVDRFIATLEEYRENYTKPMDTLNHIRADHMRQMLNRLTDDDTGKPVGDLLLNKTKYEMGDTAYNALSDTEKKDHADILTILMQANGQATLTMETLLTKATDTSDDTWIDRFSATGLEDLKDRIMDEDPGIKSLTDLNAAMDRKYHDTATALLNKWNDFYEEVAGAKDRVDELENSVEEIDRISEKIEAADLENMSEKEMNTMADTVNELTETAYDARSIGLCSYLEAVDYGDGTMLEFFEKEYSELSTDSGIRSLYPMVDALSPGQIAGLDFLSLADLISLAIADKDTYADIQSDMSEMATASIYEGVDREIYEPGGVAMTSGALRDEAAKNEDQGDYMSGTLPIVMMSVTAGTVLAAVSSIISLKTIKYIGKKYYKSWRIAYNNYMVKCEYEQAKIMESRFFRLEKSIKLGKKLMKGLPVIAAIMVVADIVTTVLDAKNYYRTTFAPIPNIMVDKADITVNNDGGKDILVKNQTVYYRVVRCNRKEGTTDIEKDNYRAMEDKADLNGDIGRQWLALYSVKYEYGSPILADSLLYKKGDESVPEGYSVGIHEFGALDENNVASALNLNKKAYLFRDDPPSIKVFFKTESSNVKQLVGSKAGSIFSPGSLALGIGIGAVIGALIMGLIMRRRKVKIVDA